MNSFWEYKGDIDVEFLKGGSRVKYVREKNKEFSKFLKLKKRRVYRQRIALRE